MDASSSPDPSADRPASSEQEQSPKGSWIRKADEASEVVDFDDVKGPRAIRIVWRFVGSEWQIQVRPLGPGQAAGPSPAVPGHPEPPSTEGRLGEGDSDRPSEA